MSYAILRCAKIKSPEHLGKAFRHNLRRVAVSNADLARRSENEVLVPCEDVHSAWAARVGSRTVRKNAVRAVEVVLARSPEWVGDESAWVKRSQAWLEEQFGGPENVLSSVVHRDEQTPHIQAIVVPIDGRDRLNCVAFLGGKAKMVRLQDSYAEAMAPLGLSRGKRGSMATHQSIREHYALLAQARASAPTPPRTVMGFPLPSESERVHGEALAAHTRAVEAEATAARERADRVRAERERDLLRKQADELRAVDLASVAERLGAERDPRDRLRWRLPSGDLVALEAGGGMRYHVVSAGGGGRGAIDLVRLALGVDFRGAMAWLAQECGTEAAAAEIRRSATAMAESAVTLPSPAVPLPVSEHWSTVRQYLVGVRGCAARLVDQLHEAGALFADKFSNAVFVHSENSGVELRGTGAVPFKGSRGTKSGFLVRGTRPGLVVCESAIDAFSVVQSTCMSAVSVGGSNLAAALRWAREWLAKGEPVYAGHDADAAGARQASALMSAEPCVTRLAPPQGKDWNESLNLTSLDADVSERPVKHGPKLTR